MKRRHGSVSRSITDSNYYENYEHFWRMDYRLKILEKSRVIELACFFFTIVINKNCKMNLAKSMLSFIFDREKL